MAYTRQAALPPPDLTAIDALAKLAGFSVPAADREQLARDLASQSDSLALLGELDLPESGIPAPFDPRWLEDPAGRHVTTSCTPDGQAPHGAANFHRPPSWSTPSGVGAKADALTDLTMLEAGRLLATRQISCVELTAATLARIEATEPVIHAYALVLAEEALARARRLDDELARNGPRGPLHGMPVAVKDLYYTRGIPTEAGSRALAGFRPTEDAAAVTGLYAAGAVLLGKTVTHELAYGVNEPPTRTPWLRGGYPGGSSAGSGAALAARSAFGALGTDTGGSIREPAALNGVVGLKPTYGLVSRYGVVPLSASLDHAGPLARTVDDCAMLLAAIAGYDSRDPGSIAPPARDHAAHAGPDVAGLHLGVERAFFLQPQVHREVRQAVEAVLAEMASMGAEIVEVSLPALRYMEASGMPILLAEASVAARHLLREQAELLDPATRHMLALGELLPATHYVIAQRARLMLCRQMRDLFRAERIDALVSPTVPTTTYAIEAALVADESGEDPMSAALKYMIPANVTGLPALSVPCGFSAAGLPIGVQFMGRPFEEALLFRLGRAYERAHDWASRGPLLP